MAPSQVRKEEAELRKIAKQSRTSRKAAQLREKKQEQLTRRKKAAASTTDTSENNAEASSLTTLKKPKGAIILPAELEELRHRLASGNTVAAPASSSSSATAASSAKKKSKAAAVAAVKGKKAKGSNHPSGNTNPVGTAAAAPASSSSTAGVAVPAHREEIHFRRQLFFVDVVLHHVPPQKIDVSETTEEQLVVDTTGHTKKYRLVLPFPTGMRCDSAAATYEVDGGVLHCKLPIRDGSIPAALEEENTALTEAIRQQKALRFRVSQDGALTVRARQALLAPNEAAQAALQEEKKSSSAAKRSRSSAEADAPATTTEQTSVAKKGTTKSSNTTASPPPPTSATAATTSAAPAAKKVKKDVFKEEHEKSMEAARASAAQVRVSLKERVRMAKEVQAARQTRLAARSTRREQRADAKQRSFQRVLEEQKRQLLAQTSLQATASAEVEQRREAAIKSGNAGKKVKFSSK